MHLNKNLKLFYCHPYSNNNNNKSNINNKNNNNSNIKNGFTKRNGCSQFNDITGEKSSEIVD
jgi:hypothetical protein